MPLRLSSFGPVLSESAFQLVNIFRAPESQETDIVRNRPVGLLCPNEAPIQRTGSLILEGQLNSG